MPSRPQFSLRMLLLFVVMASLIAATVAPTETAAPATIAFYREGPQSMSLGAHVQGALRLAMCVALPAMIIAGLVQPRRHVRTFCVGALFPALAALTIVCLRIDFSLEGMHKYLQAYGRQGILMALDGLWRRLPQLRYELAAAWTLAFACGTGAVLIERVFPPCGEPIELGGAGQRRRCLWRGALFWVATLALVSLTLAKPPHTGLALRVREYLIITLSIALQGLLAVGAVRSRGAVRAFCIGAALASSLAWALVCQTLLFDAGNRGNVFGHIRQVSHPYSFAAAWVFAPIFGLACALFHRLFELGDTTDKARVDPTEEPRAAVGL